MEKELLAELRELTECSIISDLRYIDNSCLLAAIISVKADNYEIEQWLDAIIYLTGTKYTDNQDVNQAKAYLSNYYK